MSAHYCDHFGGVLAFSDHAQREDDPQYVLVRAFGQGAWVDVELVNVNV